MTKILLAYAGLSRRATQALEAMTTVRLAFGGPPNAQASGMAEDMTPAILVSYAYVKEFLDLRPRLHFRDWVLDSGAYSAMNSGAVIDRRAYLETALELLATDPQLKEVYALDVIGDPHASLDNCEFMWEHGVEAIPTYHVGSPESELLEMARKYPKIALGGAVGYKKKIQWAQQCFARVWPKKVHGFGFGSEDGIMAVPWHSTDATNWEVGPCRFGAWRSFGGKASKKLARLSVRGGNQNLRSEVEWYLRLEQQAKRKWAKQMAQLEAQDG